MLRIFRYEPVLFSNWGGTFLLIYSTDDIFNFHKWKIVLFAIFTSTNNMYQYLIINYWLECIKNNLKKNFSFKWPTFGNMKLMLDSGSRNITIFHNHKIGFRWYCSEEKCPPGWRTLWHALHHRKQMFKYLLLKHFIEVNYKYDAITPELITLFYLKKIISPKTSFFGKDGKPHLYKY